MTSKTQPSGERDMSIDCRNGAVTDEMHSSSLIRFLCALDMADK
jgi:hypothetical protein